MYVLIQFCKRIGEKNLTNALNKLSSMGGAEGIKVDGVEAWVSMLYELLLAGAKKDGVELDLKIEDCYDTITDFDLITVVSQVIAESMPNQENIRAQKKRTETTAA